MYENNVLIISIIYLCIIHTLSVSAVEVMPKENGIEKGQISTTSGSNHFSKLLPRFSSINSVASSVSSFSSDSISGSEQVVTSISLYVRVTSGSEPFILYI